MNNEISHLPHTSQALDDLDLALTGLSLAVENKKNKIIEMKNCARQSVSQIDALIEKINKACEANGSGNNNN